MLATKAGATEHATIRVNGIDGKANVACVDIVAAENSTITLNVAFDSPTPVRASSVCAPACSPARTHG